MSQQDQSIVTKIGPFIFTNLHDNQANKINELINKPSKRLTKKQICYLQQRSQKFRVKNYSLNFINNMLMKVAKLSIYQNNIVESCKYKILNNLTYQKTNQQQQQMIKCYFQPDFLPLLDFCNLSVLKLSGNHICSLQWIAISSSNFPSLLELNLQNNKLTSLKQLKKGQFNQLRKITLGLNHIITLSMAQRSFMKNLEQLDFSYNNVSDITYVYKCQFNSVYNMLRNHNFIIDHHNNKFQILKHKMKSLDR